MNYTRLQNVHSKVTVQGVTYRIMGVTVVDFGPMYGKRRFVLENSDGERFVAYGKRVAHNSRLTPDNGGEG